MNQTDLFLPFVKAIFGLAFGLSKTIFSIIFNFVFAETNEQETQEYSSDLPRISWSGLDEVSDKGIKVVSKDGFIDF